MVGDVVRAATALAGPTWFMAVGTLFTAGVVFTVSLFGFGLGALAGELGARVGGWLAGRGDPPVPPAAGA
jgi:hypothetical protein